MVEIDSPFYTKTYRDITAIHRAVRNHAWHAELSACNIPAIDRVDENTLEITFHRVPGAEPRNLSEQLLVARTLGRIHGLSSLHPNGIPGDRSRFVDERVQRIRNSRADYPHDLVDWMREKSRDALPATYKDSNLRNFLVDHDRVVVLDFDDLCWAPIGYDLAKFSLSIALTTGKFDMKSLRDIRSAYVDSYVQATGIAPGSITRELSCRTLLGWIDVNWCLTAQYVGRNGYRYTWPEAASGIRNDRTV